MVAIAWTLSVLCSFIFWEPIWQPFLVLLGLVGVFLGGWLRQKPSHDRDWDATVALLPRVTSEGDAVTIENIRNFEYHTLNDFTPRHETRTVHLENLKAADLIFFNWGSSWMSHPVFVFDFGPDGRVCVSIEVRYRKGQTYSVVRSLYRQQELIFVVADERDAILRRTKFGQSQEGRLYHFQATPDELRTAFRDYIGAIDDILRTPRWYHGVTANCTTSFYRLPHSRIRFDWRVLANARLDWALYKSGRLDRSIPFAELRRLSRLTEIANRAPETGFGDYIRRELEDRRHGR